MSELVGENPSLIANIEIIKNIEGMYVRAKIELILILLGEKPVTEIYVIDHDSDNKKIKQLKDIFSGIGIECSLHNSFQNGSGEIVYELVVAGNVADLNKRLTTNDSREFGRLFGFPATAIDAYIRAEKGEPVRLLDFTADLPEDIRESEYAPFCQFCFSDNWEEELKVPKRWSDLIKKYAPELHEKFLQGWRSFQEHYQQGLQRLSEPLEKFQQMSTPTSYELVSVDKRWGQALYDNKIRWLDTGKEEDIDWSKYELTRKFGAEAIKENMLIQTLHIFTNFELSNIETDGKNTKKFYVRVFGEYKKK